MKIEELPHIEVKRLEVDKVRLKSYYYTIEQKNLMKKNGYIPSINCMADSYSLISKILDKDCVVAYVTDKSQTTFLIKTKQQYVGFVCLSDKLSQLVGSNSTRRITRMNDWNCKEGFMKFTDGEDLIIADEDLWDKYLKAKILESLGK